MLKKMIIKETGYEVGKGSTLLVKETRNDIREEITTFKKESNS
jgi:hypothetical protein